MNQFDRKDKLIGELEENNKFLMEYRDNLIIRVKELEESLNYECQRANKGWKLHQECHDVMEKKIGELKAELAKARAMLEKTDCYHCEGWKEAEHE